MSLRYFHSADTHLGRARQASFCGPFNVCFSRLCAPLKHALRRLGSLQERFFELLTFGIPVQLLPATNDGEFQLEHHKLWVEQRQNLEMIHSSSDDKDERCLVPRPDDILMGRDKLARSHTGNIRFHHIIATRQEEYNNAPSKDEKTIIAASIVLSIKESRGRFLKLDEASWVIVSDEAARDKVTNAFRSRRRSANRSKPPKKERDVGEGPPCSKRRPDN